MQTNVMVQDKVDTRLQTISTKDGMPVILGKLFTPIIEELGSLTVIHPTTNDPVLVSSTLGSVAIWFKI